MHQSITLRYLETLKPSYVSQGYPIPKWIQFSEDMINYGCDVFLYKAKRTYSKYIIVSKNNISFRIRFSNHKAKILKEIQEDCDYYVGVGNFGCITTEEVRDILKDKFKIKRIRSNKEIADEVLRNRRVAHINLTNNKEE